MVYTQAGTDGYRNKDPSALVDGALRHSHLIHDTKATIPGKGDWLSPREHIQRRNSRHNETQHGPDSLPPNVFNQDGTFFDVRLTGAGVHNVSYIVLYYTVQNNSTIAAGTGVAVSLLHPFYMWNRYEVQSDGSFTDDTIYPLHMLLDFNYSLEQPEREKWAYGMWINPNAPSGIDRTDPATLTTFDEDTSTIAAGGIREYCMPLLNILSRSDVFLPGKTQDPRLRFYPVKDPGTNAGIAAATGTFSVTMTGLQMIVGGPIYMGKVLENLAKVYGTNLSVSRGLVHERQIINYASVTANTDGTDLSLTSFNGEYACMFLIVLNNDATKNELYDSGNAVTTDERYWVELSRFGILDSSGNPVGFNKEPSVYIRAGRESFYWPNNSFSFQKNIIAIPFAEEPIKTMREGVNTGGIVMDSNFTITQTIGNLTAADVATSAYSGIVIGLRYATLSRDQAGTFSVKKL